MSRTRTCLIAMAATATVALGFILPPSNIDPIDKWAWGENVGWLNWRDANDANDGVVVNADHLSGYVWGENVGWINLGNGGGPYGNTDGTNFGVNILPAGDLEGFGWGENLGWVNFDTSSHAPDQARYDSGAGRLRGYAWAENAGWINLDDSTHFVGASAESNCTEDGECDDGDACTVDSCAPGDAGAEPSGCLYIPGQHKFGDVAGISGVDWGCNAAMTQPDLGDILCILEDFIDGVVADGCPGNPGYLGAGTYSDLVKDSSGSPDSCDPNGVDLDDILAVLAAFGNGSDPFFGPPCPSPCPCP